MRIIVCIKQVPDPQASSSGTKVDSEAKKVIMPQGTPPVMNPYDENALEAALKIKDAHSARVTVIGKKRVSRRKCRPRCGKVIASPPARRGIECAPACSLASLTPLRRPS